VTGRPGDGRRARAAHAGDLGAERPGDDEGVGVGERDAAGRRQHCDPARRPHAHVERTAHQLDRGGVGRARDDVQRGVLPDRNPRPVGEVQLGLAGSERDRIATHSEVESIGQRPQRIAGVERVADRPGEPDQLRRCGDDGDGRGGKRDHLRPLRRRRE
jgi:hypothetical protein